MNKPSRPPSSQLEDSERLTPAQQEKLQQEETIYRYIMRGGGEPFGAPYEIGKQSLTEKIVRFFKQKSFF